MANCGTRVSVAAVVIILMGQTLKSAQNMEPCTVCPRKLFDDTASTFLFTFCVVSPAFCYVGSGSEKMNGLYSLHLKPRLKAEHKQIMPM